MGLKDAFDNLAKSVTDAIDNAKDAASEAGHRTDAEAERAKRDVAGDAMPLGDKVKSVASEFTHETLAEVDKAKRDARNA